MIFAALLLSLVAGLRAASVGIDTQNYTELFARIAEGRLDLAYGLETTFKYICAFLLGIWNNSNFLFLVFALITNILIFSRLWDFRDHISLPWATAIYFGVFYFMTFNIVRQFVAVSIIFFATRYLAQKKYFKFLVFVLIAFLFHKSALIGVLFIVLDIFAWKELTKKQKRIIVLLWVLGAIAALFLGTIILGKYVNYFKAAQFNFGIMLFLKLIIYTFTALFMMGDDWKDKNDVGYDPISYSHNMSKVYYIIGILITMLGYMFQYMDRIGLYFYLFEAIYIGKVMKSRRVDTIVKLAVGVLYVVILAGAILGDGQGHGEYLFFWQQQ